MRESVKVCSRALIRIILQIFVIYNVESIGFIMLDLEGICRDLLVYFIDGCIGLFVASGFHDTWRRWKSHGEICIAIE